MKKRIMVFLSFLYLTFGVNAQDLSQECVERVQSAVENYRDNIKSERFTATLDSKEVRGSIEYGPDDVIVVENITDGEELELHVRDGEIFRGRFTDNFGDTRRVNTRDLDQFLVGLVTYEDVAALSWRGFTPERFTFSECKAGPLWSVRLTPKDGVETSFAYQILSGGEDTITSRELYRKRGGKTAVSRTLIFIIIRQDGVWRPSEVAITTYRAGQALETNILRASFTLNRR